MQPDLILIPFGKNATAGTIEPIPDTAGPGDGPQKATWNYGFPQVTMTPLAAGGIPPQGQDVNGVLNAISEHTVFSGAGGQYTWSADYVAANVGYPKGALVARSDLSGYWQNTVDLNTSNPDSGGAGWIPLSGRGGDFAIATGTANTYVCAFTPAIIARAEGQVLKFKVNAANTGASTFNDGLGAVALVGGAQAALQGGELVANGDAWVQWNTSVGGGSYVLLFCTGAARQIALATQSQQAVNLGQLASGASLTTPALFDNSAKMATTSFVQRAIGNFSFSQQLSASTTLTPAYVGQHVWLAGTTSYTITLPVAGTVANGSALWLWSSNSATITVNVAGTDNMLVNSSSIATITLNEGDTLFLIANTAVGWIAIGGSRQLGYSNVFLSSSGVNGFQRLPGGLLECRGTFTSSSTAGAPAAITFPRAFSTLYEIVITPNSASTSIVSAWYDSGTGTGFNGHCNLASTVCSYIAKGAA